MKPIALHENTCFLGLKVENKIRLNEDSQCTQHIAAQMHTSVNGTPNTYTLNLGG